MENIEKHLRQQWLAHVGPQIGFFYQTGNENRTRTTPASVKSCIGELIITEKQAKKLEVKKSTRLSPLFEKCCLRQIANISYENAASYMEVLTGVKIGHTCLHRLLKKQEWSEPIAFFEVEETSIDGGKVRLRGKLGEGSHWQDYKAVRLHESSYRAFYQDNEALINYINHQPLAEILTCRL